MPTAWPVRSLVPATPLQQANITQWGGSFYPVYLRPANLSHEAWTKEKAAHLWALLPVFVPNPEELGSTDPIVGDLCRQARMELHNACMAFLTLGLLLATRLGVVIVEVGHHVCTLFPHAWGHLVDRAELAGCTGTSFTWLVQYACAHCLVPRSLWVDPPWHPLTWWDARRRCRAQMLLLVDEDLPTNKLQEGGAYWAWGHPYGDVPASPFTP